MSVSRDFNSIPKAATLIALAFVLALAVPAVASAQVLDPTLDQYAPSTQQIDKQVKGDDGGGGAGQASQGGGGQPPQGGGGQVPEGGGGAQGPQAGGGGQGPQAGGGGEAAPGRDGGAVQQGGDGAAEPARAEGGGLDDRVVGGVPLTGFDLVALAVAAAVIAGTAVLLRRLSRRPEPRT